MRRINLKKTITALSLAAAMAVSSFAIGGDLNTVQAATKKRNVITKADYNDGSTVKFSYNKKGLVTKSVSKKSYKTSNTDVTETVTTKYKYNKKDKIATKTATTVTTTTYYSTDKTTGLNVTATEGTVTETRTEETKFTYNKKGLAQESVTTGTTVKSGSRTTTSVTNNVIGGNYDEDDEDYDDEDYDDDDDQTYVTREMSDGRILAGYNRYKVDGTINHENTSANAFYYTGSVGDGTTTTVTTTTYTDNGDGTFKKDVTRTTTRKGYSTSEVELLYARNKDNVAVQVTPEKVTKTYTDDEDEDYDDEDEYYDDEDDEDEYYDNYHESYNEQTGVTTVTYTIYKDAGGNEYRHPDFTIVTSVAVAPSGSVSTSTDSTSNVYTDKNVDTTKYSYDKKKRVKKADSTNVITWTDTWTSTYSYDGGSSKNSDTHKGEYLEETTNVYTTTYSYDKKGRAKKVVWSDSGVANSSAKESEMKTGGSSQYTSYNGITTTSNTTYTCDTYPTVTTTVVKDGVKTITTTKNPYTTTTTRTSSNGSGSTSTDAYSYTANGGRKTVSTYSNGIYNNVGTEYSFDKYSSTSAYIESSNGTVIDSNYDDGSKDWYGEEAITKMAGAVAAFDAAIAPYNEVETEAVIATPAQDTTKFKYDKNGNVKTAKKSGTYVDIDTQVNEVYGNTIYEFDAATGKAKPKQIATTHTYTNKDSNDTTVKNGTKNITKQYTSSESTEDRNDSGESVIDRVKYKLKGKKASSNAKKQQWIIQNGPLNGQVGLD